MPETSTFVPAKWMCPPTTTRSEFSPLTLNPQPSSPQPTTRTPQPAARIPKSATGRNPKSVTLFFFRRPSISSNLRALNPNPKCNTLPPGFLRPPSPPNPSYPFPKA